MIRSLDEYLEHLIKNGIYGGIEFKLSLCEYLVEKNIIKTPEQYIGVLEYKEKTND